MAAPTRVASWAVSNWAGQTLNGGPFTSGSLSVQAGDFIVVWAAVGNAADGPSITFSDSQSNSYTNRQTNTGTGSSLVGYSRLATAVAGSTGSMTVTATTSYSGGGGAAVGFCVEVWRGDGIGASNQADNGTGSGTPSVGLTTTSDNSAVLAFVNDWNAVNTDGTWSSSPSTPTEVEDFGDNSTYGIHTAYYTDVGSTGAKTIAMTAPTTQRYQIMAIEITGTAAVNVDQSGFQFFDDDGALPGYSYGTTPVIETADVTSSGNNTASNPSVTYPAYSTGDLLIQFVAIDQNRTITPPATGPNGETRTIIANSTGGDANGPALCAIYWVATAGQSSGNTSWSLDTTDSWDAQTIRVPAGEFDPAKPIDVVSSVGTSTNGTDPVATMPAFTADRASGRIVAVGGVDADPMDATFSPTGWTDLYDSDIGAVCSFSAIRDAATSAGESVASADFGINTGDTNTVVGFVVNAPRSQTGATATAALNTNPELDVDTTYRWHARVENSGAATTQATWKVQYKHIEGTNTWTDVSSSSSVIRATLSSSFANGDDVTEFIGGDGTFVTNNNAALESSGSATLAAVLGATAAFELHLAFQVRSADVDDADTIQLRIVESDGTALDSYTNTPTITANESASFTTGTGAASGTGAATAVGASTADSDGVAAGTGAASATGSSTVDSDGASAGTGTATGVGSAIFEGVGAASGTGAASGDGLGVNTADGAAAGTGTASAVGASTADSDGVAAGTGAATGVGSATFDADGAAAGTGTATGVGAATFDADGAADGTGDASGVGQGVTVSDGSAAGTGVASGIGASVADSDGSAAGTGDASAIGAATFDADGSAAGTGTAAATGATLADSEGVGDAAGVGAATGVGASTAAAAGASAGIGAAGATGQSSADGIGAAAATGDAAAVGSSVADADGAAAGTGAAAAVGASVGGGNVGTATGEGAASGVGASVAASVGDASGVGAATGVGAGGAETPTLPYQGEVGGGGYWVKVGEEVERVALVARPIVLRITTTPGRVSQPEIIEPAALAGQGARLRLVAGTATIGIDDTAEVIDLVARIRAIEADAKKSPTERRLDALEAQMKKLLQGSG